MIKVWEIVAAKIIRQFIGHDQAVSSLDYARNGKFIASGSLDGTVRLWDLESGQQFLQLLIDDGVITVAISPNNQLIAAGSPDK